MTTKESRTPEKIFFDMHRELRVWNPEIPESPDRLDPILKILLQIYAHQLSIIDKRIDMVWEMATNSLIRSVCPESKRWPVPAYTVMRCKPTDPVVDVDHHSRFFYKEKREGGQTFFFSSLRKERLLTAEVRYVFLTIGDRVMNLSPSGGAGLPSQPRSQVTSLPSGGHGHIYIGIDYPGPAGNFQGAALFIKGIPDILKQLRWAYWYPGSQSGGFSQQSGFCPGLGDGISEMFIVGGRAIEWGGMRTGRDLFKALEENFIILSEKFASSWESGPINEELARACAASGIQPPPGNVKTYWIRLDLPHGGDKLKLQSSFEIYFNCFIAINKNELTLFKHTGGNRLVEVEIPEGLNNILDITSVFDSSGREYLPRHMVQSNRTQRSYAMEERDGKMVLWFDFSGDIELPPDSITINYSITAGTDANGIEAGKINELYEKHPGIKSAENIIPVAGAIPAKTEEQIVTEVSARLRNRDRALNFAEISNWATTFDPRIRQAECRNGVERAERGVRRCIVVRITVRGVDFYSDDETILLQKRLQSFLKSLAPVNTHFKVEISKE